MTDSSTTTTPGTDVRDGFWGTVGWIYPGLGLSALVGVALSGPSAIEAWEPWEYLGRATVGVSLVLAVVGGALALCVGWALEALKKRREGEPAPTEAATTNGDGPVEEVTDPTATRLGGLSNRRTVLWVLIGILCGAMGVLGEVARKRTNRLPVGTKTGDAVAPEVWTAVMIVVALLVATLVILCLVEDRVRRTSQRDWLRAQLREPMPPAKRTRQFYRGRATPHASRACALLAAPFLTSGLAVLVVGSVELGEAFTGSTEAYADFRVWGIVAVLVGLLLLVLGAVRATRWHRENVGLRDEIIEAAG